MRTQVLQALALSSIGLLSTAAHAGAQASAAPDVVSPFVVEQPVDADPAELVTPSPPAVTPDPAASSDPDDQNNNVPRVEHTGITTLARDTWKDFTHYPRRESTWVILGVGGALAALALPVDDDVNEYLLDHSGADNFWKPGHIIGGPVMWGVPVGLYLGGRYVLPRFTDDVDRTNKWSHLGLDLIRAEILDEVIVRALKVSVQRTRPNGQNYSFPSGHAASTFALAAVLERHLGYRAAWPTIAIASYVATSRLHDNVHFLSDVIFGAAIGTTAGWTVVGGHGRTNYAMAPVPVPGGMAFMVTRKPTASN